MQKCIDPLKTMTSNILKATEHTNGVIKHEDDEQENGHSDVENFYPKKKSIATYLKTITENKQCNIEKENKEEQNAMQTFFQSLLPEAEALNTKRRRKFKSIVLETLNSLMEEQESERSCISLPVSMVKLGALPQYSSDEDLSHH